MPGSRRRGRPVRRRVNAWLPVGIPALLAPALLTLSLVTPGPPPAAAGPVAPGPRAAAAGGWLYVSFCPGHHARRGRKKAHKADTSHAGWPPDQCLKMDKGPAGPSHTIDGQKGVHNWLLGGYGNDTIVGGDLGDVIWGDYHPNAKPAHQTAVIEGGDGRNFIYANDSVNYVWTGTNPKTVVHAFLAGTSGVIHCQSPGVVVFLSRTSQRHFKLDGCHRISHYSVGH